MTDEKKGRGPEDPESSWGYPAFAREFPRHAELDALVAAFARGDYQAVRERAPKLASSDVDTAVKTAARTLRERIEPDPASKLLFLLAATLLAFLTVWWVSHGGSEGNGSSPSGAPVKPASTGQHVDGNDGGARETGRVHVQ